MSAPETTDPVFDPEAWARMGFSERVRLACREYVGSGVGYPPAVYLFHGAKLGLFVLGWLFFCWLSPGLGNPLEIQSWIFEGAAFQKAFLWASLVEVTGFGCTSGPLGGHFSPMFTAYWHFLRPGTAKAAPFPKAPIIGGTKRTWLDVALYVGYVAALVRALIAPEIEATHLVPIVALLPLCALCDKTVVLAARVEHHYAMIVCFLLAGDWIAGAKWVQLAIWFWAGVSKLTVAFPYVVPIMTANNPALRSQFVRRRLFVSPPDDVSPSRLAHVMAHAGGFLEFAAPLTLVFVTADGPLLYLGLFWVVMLHGFILSNVPLAAVFEWNVLSVYAGFFLFMGRLSHEKGADLLGLVQAELERGSNSARLVVAGAGPLGSGVSAMADVRLLGERSDPETVLQAADVLLMPSRQEGLPMVALEAAALGVPVVGFAVGGLADSRLAEAVPTEDVQTLVAVGLHQLRNPAARRGRLAAAREALESRFDPAGHAAALSDLYGSV